MINFTNLVFSKTMAIFTRQNSVSVGSQWVIFDLLKCLGRKSLQTIVVITPFRLTTSNKCFFNLFPYEYYLSQLFFQLHLKQFVMRNLRAHYFFDFLQYHCFYSVNMPKIIFVVPTASCNTKESWNVTFNKKYFYFIKNCMKEIFLRNELSTACHHEFYSGREYSLIQLWNHWHKYRLCPGVVKIEFF